MTLETDIGCLRQLPLFRTLPAPRLKLVALMGEKLHFEAGVQLVAEGETPEAVHLIMDGEVELLHPAPDGGGKRFLFESGSILGDVPILAGQPYVGEVRAKTDVTALRLPKDLFFELLQTVPEFSLAVSRHLAARLYRLADFVLHNEKVH